MNEPSEDARNIPNVIETKQSDGSVSSTTIAKRDIPKYLSFIPEQLVARLDGLDELNSNSRTEFSVVMLADVSGFTKLSSYLCSKGPSGMDQLSETISDFFGELISLVRRYGGDVLNFAGDALLISWRCNVECGLLKEEQIIRSFQCGLELSQLERDHMTLHVGIASGTTTTCVLGGGGESSFEVGTWCYVIVGEPLLRMGGAEGHAKSKEVVATHETYLIVDKYCVGTEIATSEDFGLVLLEQVNKPDEMEWGIQQEPLNDSNSYGLFCLKLQAFIPQPASEALKTSSTFLNEYRKRLSVCFIMLEGFCAEGSDPNVSGESICKELQGILCTLQRSLKSFGGMQRQFIIDDKGCVFIAAFGVPGYMHKDDPDRAVLFSLQVTQQLEKDHAIHSYVGVTTGPAFCGQVGSRERREYAMIGADVNFAARLMAHASQRAKENDKFSLVVCDQSTAKSMVNDKLQVEEIEKSLFKGSDEPKSVFGVFFVDTNLAPRIERTVRIIGRKDELNKLNTILDLTDESKSLFIIEGKQGMGKTLFIDAARRRCQHLNINDSTTRILSATGQDLEKGIPFFAFRQLFWFILEYNAWSKLNKKGNSCSNNERERLQRMVLTKLLDDIASLDSAGLNQGVAQIPDIERASSNSDMKKKYSFSGGPRPKLNRKPTGTALRGHLLTRKNSSNIHVEPGSTRKIVLSDTPEVSKRRIINEVLFPVFKQILRLGWDLTEDKEASQNNNNVISNAPYVLRLMFRVLKKRRTWEDKNVIIFIDDEQHVDSLSRVAINEMIGIFDKKLCIVASVLPGSLQSEWMSTMESIGTVCRLELNPLLQSDMLELIRPMRGSEYSSSNDEDAIQNFVIEHSHGNPGQGVELAKTLQESKSENIKNEGALDTFDIAKNILEQAIQIRFDQLHDTQRGVLKIASAIGGMFSKECLKSMLPRNLTRHDPAILSRILDELVAAEWIDLVEDFDSSETWYTFHRKILQDALYALNPTSRLTHLHLSAAQYIEKKYDSDLRPYFSVLTRHYMKAKKDSVALNFLVLSYRFNAAVGMLPETLEVINTIKKLDVPKKLLLSVFVEMFKYLDLVRGNETGAYIGGDDINGTECGFSAHQYDNVADGLEFAYTEISKLPEKRRESSFDPKFQNPVEKSPSSTTCVIL